MHLGLIQKNNPHKPYNQMRKHLKFQDNLPRRLIRERIKSEPLKTAAHNGQCSTERQRRNATPTPLPRRSFSTTVGGRPDNVQEEPLVSLRSAAGK